MLSPNTRGGGKVAVDRVSAAWCNPLQCWLNVAVRLGILTLQDHLRRLRQRGAVGRGPGLPALPEHQVDDPAGGVAVAVGVPLDLV